MSAVIRRCPPILAVVVVSAALAGAGPATAYSGPSGGALSFEAQYGSPSTSPAPSLEVLGDKGSGGPPSAGTSPSASRQTPAMRVARQELGSRTSLPFTGWALAPIVLVGLLLFSGGVFLRQASSRRAPAG